MRSQILALALPTLAACGGTPVLRTSFDPSAQEIKGIADEVFRIAQQAAKDTRQSNVPPQVHFVREDKRTFESTKFASHNNSTCELATDDFTFRLRCDTPNGVHSVNVEVDQSDPVFAFLRVCEEPSSGAVNCVKITTESSERRLVEDAIAQVQEMDQDKVFDFPQIAITPQDGVFLPTEHTLARSRTLSGCYSLANSFDESVATVDKTIEQGTDTPKLARFKLQEGSETCHVAFGFLGEGEKEIPQVLTLGFEGTDGTLTQLSYIYSTGLITLKDQAKSEDANIIGLGVLPETALWIRKIGNKIQGIYLEDRERRREATPRRGSFTGHFLKQLRPKS